MMVTQLNPDIYNRRTKSSTIMSDMWCDTGGNPHVLLIALMMALFYSSVLVSHDCVNVMTHAHYQEPETEVSHSFSEMSSTS